MSKFLAIAIVLIAFCGSAEARGRRHHHRHSQSCGQQQPAQQAVPVNVGSVHYLGPKGPFLPTPTGTVVCPNCPK